jgi:predicted GH43/DUF377 family glycosyl hydrolase
MWKPLSVLLLLLLLCGCLGLAQTTWTRHASNPVFNGNSSLLADPLRLDWAFRPAVIFDPSKNAYQSWFSSLTPWAGSYEFAFSNACSFDGSNWYYYSKNPVLQAGPGAFDAAYLSACSVLKDAGGYKMYYSARTAGTNFSIGLATSSDGIHWQKYGGNPIVMIGAPGSWDDVFVEMPKVLLVDGTYYMWYMGYDGLAGRIGLATSVDGVSWTKHPSNPVLAPGAPGSWDGYWLGEGSVVFANGVFYMLYMGAPGDYLERIGLATSTNGYSWQKYSGNPVMVPTSGWESARIAPSAVVLRDNTFHLWFSGSSGGRWQGGYATSPLEYPPSPSNVIANPGFENGPAPWSFYTNGAGTFAVVTPGSQSLKAARINITTAGTNVQLSQTGFPLDPHAAYQLSFDAYSSTGHDIAVYLHRNTSPYTNYGVSNFVANLTPGWQHYTLVFTTTGFASQTTDSRLRFWLSPYDASGDQYFVDNVSIARLAEGTLVADTKTEARGVPEKAGVSQNYPNPFNPETVIAFDVPVDSPVLLEVFNALGERVSTLVDGPLPAGQHRVTFHGSALSSGTYFYRLTLNEQGNSPKVLHGKMLLLK